MLADQRTTLRSLPKRFPLLTWGYAHCHWVNPSCPGPGGAEVTCPENLQNCYPLSPWVTHPGFSGVAWRQYVQAGVKGSEEEPCPRVTKPWHIQPITFFSQLSKDPTHMGAQLSQQN